MSQVDSIKESISELTEMFHNGIAELRSDLDKADSRDSSGSSVAAKLDTFKSFIVRALETLQKQVHLISRQVDQMEMRSRRKMLVVRGIPEVDKEMTSALVVEQLKVVSKDFTVEDVRRSHRLGRRSGSKPRAILVKFCDSAIRDKMWFGKVALKGSGVTLSEFLTKARQEAFMAARERFGVRSCWTWEGVVHVLGADGVRRRVVSLAELNAIPVALAPSDNLVAGGNPQAGSRGAEKPTSNRPKRTTTKSKP